MGSCVHCLFFGTDTLVAGERTLMAAKLAGLTHVDVKILDSEFSPGEIKQLQLIENLMREGLDDAEIYLACKELMALNPDWLKKDLAAALHFDASMVTRIFSVDELIPEAKEAFLAGEFGFSKAYAIVKGPKEDQHRKLAEVLAGASRDDVERKGRIGRGKNPDVKKLSRVRIECRMVRASLSAGAGSTWRGWPTCSRKPSRKSARRRRSTTSSLSPRCSASRRERG